MEGMVRHPSTDGDGPGMGFKWGRLSLNGTHPVRLRRPPLRGRGFAEEPPMPATLVFIVIPAQAGIQRQAKPAGTTRG
jgi:hypothetical protein